MLQLASIKEVERNAGCPKRMAGRRRTDSCVHQATFDHRENFPSVDPSFGKVAMPVNRAEEGSALGILESSGSKICVENLFGLVVYGNRMFAAALFVESKPPPFTLLK